MIADEIQKRDPDWWAGEFDKAVTTPKPSLINFQLRDHKRLAIMWIDAGAKVYLLKQKSSDTIGPGNINQVFQSLCLAYSDFLRGRTPANTTISAFVASPGEGA